MKKIGLIFCSLLIMLMFPLNIMANTTCEYDKLIVTFKDSGGVEIESSFYNDFNGVESYLLKYASMATGYLTLGLAPSINVNTNSIAFATKRLNEYEKELHGACPSNLYACTLGQTSAETGLLNFFSDEHGVINVLKQVYIFDSKTQMLENKDIGSLNEGINVGSEWKNTVDAFNACDWSGKDSAWYSKLAGKIVGGICFIGTGVYDVVKSTITQEHFYIKDRTCNDYKYTGDKPTYNLSCPNLGVYQIRYSNAILSYKKCAEDDASCKTNGMKQVNKQETAIKKYCKSILENYNYDGSSQQECLDVCMEISKYIQEEKDRILGHQEIEFDCGFSQRLGTWILNIFKWIKYILPVLVIVLGILDFIKAISGDKEDEMKKAQKNFIIRLISAALVFIIPLILEFVLIKMGFTYEGCGLF